MCGKPWLLISIKALILHTKPDKMAHIDSVLCHLSHYRGLFAVGNAPYVFKVPSSLLIRIPNYGVVAILVNKHRHVSVLDPYGQFHPSIKEYLKMCNLPHVVHNTFPCLNEHDELCSSFIQAFK